MSSLSELYEKTKITIESSEDQWLITWFKTKTDEEVGNGSCVRAGGYDMLNRLTSDIAQNAFSFIVRRINL